MLIFKIIAVLSIIGVFFRQTYVRFQAAVAAEGRSSRAFDPAAYWKWLWRGAKAAFRPETAVKSWSVYKDWTNRYYPGWTMWFFVGLTISLLYQTSSGFLFAIFSPRGLFGLPLLVHVMSGGLFAVSLAAVMLLRARDYRLDNEESAAFEAFACPVLKNLSKAFVRKALFWAFCGLGLVQITTVLASMVPLFTFRTQQVLIYIHRYSGLTVLLAAVIFIDITFIPERPERRPAGESNL